MSCSGVCQCKKPQDQDQLSESCKTKDDVWGSDEESISPYADLQRAHINQGYLDGVVKAQESGLQHGFDRGFPEGAVLGMRVGVILAKLHGSSEYEQAQKALNITKVLDKSYFDEQLDLEEHILVKKWETIADCQVTSQKIT